MYIHIYIYTNKRKTFQNYSYIFVMIFISAKPIFFTILDLHLQRKKMQI